MAEVAEFYNLTCCGIRHPHSVSALLARQMLARAASGYPSSPRLHGRTLRWWTIEATSDRLVTPFREATGVTSISNYLKEKTLEDFEITRPIEVILTS